MDVSASTEAFLSIGIVGTALSFAVDFLKAKFGTESAQTKAITIVGSVVLGGFVWFFQGTDVWKAMLGVLASASTIYALFLKR